MFKTRITAILLLIAGLGVGYFVYSSELSTDGNEASHPFKLGLDLSGGTHLVYQADVSSIEASELNDSMDALRDIIERRVNMFGVSEPIVQIERSGIIGNADDSKEQRLIVELPGVTDVTKAVDMIGATPILEFKKELPLEQLQAIDAARTELKTAQENDMQDYELNTLVFEDGYETTELTGRFLAKSSMEFDPTTRAPYIALNFNSEGADLFAALTKENLGKTIAIYLDGEMISSPVVQSEITNGKAIITGHFTVEEAKTLVGRLNSGALPVDKLELLSTQTIGPSLGAVALDAGVSAGLWGLILVAIFLIVWYRLPGFIAVVSLGIYISIILALFKIMPVTLTAAGIAGFILSIGMAVDANILIFERMKEEIKSGHGLEESIREGFTRAWLSIRDGNMSSIITAVILFWFGTSLVEGFALTFGLGIMVSMFSAITLTRTFLLAVAGKGTAPKCLVKAFGSGFLKDNSLTN